MALAHEIRETVLYPKRLAKRRFREEILSDWGHLCAYCSAEVGNTLDHVIPKFKNGSYDRHNLVACCPGCNRSKGSDDWLAWFKAQVFFCEKRARRIEQWLRGLDSRSWIPFEIAPSRD